ncbi:MAG: hypothetical protein ABR586_00585, partial [Thermoplasmatota archaeon]
LTSPCPNFQFRINETVSMNADLTWNEERNRIRLVLEDEFGNKNVGGIEYKASVLRIEVPPGHYFLKIFPEVVVSDEWHVNVTFAWPGS